MKKYLVAILMACGSSIFAQTNPYEIAWKYLNENNRPEAEKSLQKAMENSSYYDDAFITDLYLKTYNRKEDEVKNFINSFYKKSANPYPYIFALWSNKAVAGAVGKKTSGSEVELLNTILSDKNAPGTLVAAANYNEKMHYLFSGEFQKSQSYSEAVGNIKDWQFVGPFENLSQSGFYKDYGPLEHPEPNAVFKSISNADIKWFTPQIESKDGWTPIVYQFNKATAVVYAQSFVSSAEAQTVYCSIGCAGSIKVWVNDELVISESKERSTELDNYSVKYDLKKGANRILVQLGYTNASYPSFSLRLTDEHYRPLSNINVSSNFVSYPKNTGGEKKYELIPGFAKKYFIQKIEKDKNNLLNYLLLADVYLRSENLLEAHNTLTDALKIAPGNCLIRMKLLAVLNQEKNNTAYQEELEKIKKADPESVDVYDLNIEELYKNEKYQECENALEKRIKAYGETEVTDAYELMLLAQDKKYDDLVKVAEKMYAKYPGNAKLLPMMYNIKKEVYKDNKGALKVYDNFMKDNYDYDTYIKYADLLIDQGNTKKGLEIKEDLAKRFSFAPVGFYKLSQYFFSIKQYDKAEDNIKKSLVLSPYNEDYWQQLGDIQSEKNNVAEALDAYNQSLKYDPNQYDIISKIRKLNNKPEIYKLFPQVDIDKEIANDNPDEAQNKDYGYYYILDQQDAVIYPDGANEQYCTMILKITNEKGVEKYKETSIGYNNDQSLLIEKAQIIKKNQAKIDGERNDNEIVFTNLEAGDYIVMKYRLQSYASGRFAKDFWDKYYFNGKIYCRATKYNLLIPATQKFKYLLTNSNIQPTVTDVEDFKKYSWEMIKATPLKDEPLMPLVIDQGAILHLSTVSSWKDIADWYSDISNNKSEKDFEILALYKKLFPDDNKSMSQFEKAKIIYDYIESNIRYSSVSFRQSAFVPQRASATLITRLGDCKDLSNLFVTLARMAGINAQMVLVDTRDNGEKDMMLPSVEFNHCIAKAILDNKPYFIELTDNYLPFASLPNILNGALALEIPVKPNAENKELIHLHAANRKKDIIKRIIDIKPEEEDLKISVKSILYGSFSASTRQDYRNLDNEKQIQEMEKVVAGRYKNNVSLDKVHFNGLDKLDDSISYDYSYKVKNEVAEIGSLNTFKIVYPDIVATLDNFSADKREFPVEYWDYETADAYETVVNITAPDGKSFVELPKGESVSFKDMKFSISYTLKAPNKLTVIRKFSNARSQQISKEDYPAFKAFFEKIVKSEQKFIAFK